MRFRTSTQSSMAGRVLFLDLENQLMPMPLAGSLVAGAGGIKGLKVSTSWLLFAPNQNASRSWAAI